MRGDVGEPARGEGEKVGGEGGWSRGGRRARVHGIRGRRSWRFASSTRPLMAAVVWDRGEESREGEGDAGSTWQRRERLTAGPSRERGIGKAGVERWPSDFNPTVAIDEGVLSGRAGQMGRCARGRNGPDQGFGPKAIWIFKLIFHLI